MDQLTSLIAGYYNRMHETEWERMDRHPTEFAVTRKALEAYLPEPPARILDCGGGPGRYAIELARQGYQVTLFDLSVENLNFALKKANEAGVTLAACEQGTATDLSRFQTGAFDAVLLMGPLYHLLEEDERRRAITEALRVLMPGGVLFAAFISRFAAHRDAVRKNPSMLLKDPQLTEALITSGRLIPQRADNSEFIAYLAHPVEVVPFCQSAGLEVLTLLGLEGLTSMIDEKLNLLSGDEWQRWLDLNYRVAADPSIHGCVEHLLAVGIKPRWKEVLRQMVQKLDTSKISYKVVGGTSLALRGILPHVKDIDLEMDAEAVYHFQELFREHIVQPVRLSESDTYRSHFGRFVINGIKVEIMGDLHRREEGGWVPTGTTTWSTIDLDGTPVRAAWLEEETLAYIRRGRMERAALCLPYCDQGKLLALIRGEQATNVV